MQQNIGQFLEENLLQENCDLGDLFDKTTSPNIQSKLHKNGLKTTMLMFWSGQVRVQTSVQLKNVRLYLRRAVYFTIPMHPDSLSSFAKKSGGNIAESRCAKLMETYTHS